MGRPLLPLALSLALALPHPGVAQDTLPPWQGGLTASLGQPPRRHWYAGGALAADRRAHSTGLSLLGTVGLMEPLGNPVTGLLAVAAEAYAGARVSEPTAGARALLEVPNLGLAGGVDYSTAYRRLSPLVAWALPLRRGGIVGKGSLLRAEWLTAADAVRVSVLVPLHQPWAGHTRPRDAAVSLPSRPAPATEPPADAPASLAEALANVRAAALRIEELVVPSLNEPGDDPEQALAPLIERLRAPASLPGVAAGPDLQVEPVVRAFHEELARAFGIAATGRPLAPFEAAPVGDSLEALARRALLDHVLLPCDRLLGQRKSGRAVASLGAYASGNFARAILAARLVPQERRDAVLYVFQELLGAAAAVEELARERWGGSRELWLPLQLGLLPEEHDTQAELDDLVQRAVGREFTDGNRVSYVINVQLQSEVQQSIRDARDYHVLWIHDFRGFTEKGEPDRMSFSYVVQAYLEALTRAVRAYDGDPRHRLPIFMIFIDEHYYEVTSGRLWLTLLEHPLYKGLVLPAGNDSLEAAVDSAQRSLRAAVAASRLLQAERRQYGEAWLENLVSVHVNVTNPADPSFRARGILPLLGIPDNVIRDHRKIVFYDVTEEDPYRGMALYTGIGVGELYAGPKWEDRAILVQGPALLSLKEQARQLLLSQGMRPAQIPFPLRPRAKAADYDQAVEDEIARQHGAGRAMELHNLTGYADKPIDVARAILYSLMPPGSVVKVPDSLWGCKLYAALLAGSALRGVRALIIAPSFEASSSRGFPQMALTHELFARLIVLQRALGPELEAAGGLLKTGLYNPGVGVEDVMGRFEVAYRNARRTPFLRRLLDLHPSVDTMLVHMREAAAAAGLPGLTRPAPASDTIMPQLHLKSNFFASRDGWDSLVTRPEVATAIWIYAGQLLSGGDPRTASEQLSLASQELVERFLAGRSATERERAVYYLMVGSANQDYRSMFLDGEATVLLSGRAAVVGLVDFALLACLTVWVDDLQTLDDLLPPPSILKLRFAHWIALML